MPTANGTSKTPSKISSGAIRQIGFLPLLAVFYGYTCGGPFGYEQIFKSSGPGMAVLFLALVPFFWSIPISLASSEVTKIVLLGVLACSNITHSCTFTPFSADQTYRTTLSPSGSASAQ